MTPEAMTVGGAFLVGLLGGGHCVGMCGGIVGALSLGLPEARRGGLAALPFQLLYNVGRIASYTAAGALMGGLGFLLAGLLPVYVAQRALLVLAGLFMLLLGLQLGGWWGLLARVERVGAGLWRAIEPRARRLLPIRTPSQALALGALWGWLPCGLVYSVLIWSVASGGPLEGAALMLAFGLGTLPNLLALGVASGGLARLLRDRRARRIAGLVVIALGLWTLWGAF